MSASRDVLLTDQRESVCDPANIPYTTLSGATSCRAAKPVSFTGPEGAVRRLQFQVGARLLWP